MSENQIYNAFPYLRIRNTGDTIEFSRKAFENEEPFSLAEPGARISHVELQFGSFTVMLSDEYPEYGILEPTAYGGAGSSIHLHAEDMDVMTKQIEVSSAQVIMEPKDQFYSERSSKVLAPFSHEWLLGSHIKDVTPEEIQQRFTAMFDDIPPESE